ncbi:MAG: succinylglutamate desuccinylase/aspartoacylase family protein [Planctomycetota bacterium]
MNRPGQSGLPRELGRIEGARPGPLLLVVGGIHGNEPGGVVAAERILREQRRSGSLGRGRVVFLVGNRRALRENVRFVDEDLNRLWVGGAAPRSADAHELIERDELAAALEAERADGPWESVVLLDLHSTSGEGPPFAILADTLQNRRLVEELPIPVLLGLEERIDGTLISAFGRRGDRALCVEGGANGTASTAVAHEAAIRLVGARLGVLPAGADELEAARRELARQANGAPAWSRLTGLYRIDERETFRMLPGFQNFDHIHAGQRLALGGPSGNEAIVAPKDSLLVMPRYQGQGSDGFYFAEELSADWRALSRALRRAGLRQILGELLVEADEDGRVLVAHPTLPMARRRLLALLGYHVAESRGGILRLRRRFDPSFDAAEGKHRDAGSSNVGTSDQCAF